MKKSLFIAVLGLAMVFSSCKKNNEPSFSAANETGTTQFTGVIVKEQEGGSTAPISGVVVTVDIKNSQLYPNSPTAQGSNVYSGTTDANGLFSINVVTNGNGIRARVNVANTISSYDPIGGTQVLFQVSNDPGHLYFVAGVPVSASYTMVPTTGTGTAVTGTATVTGTVKEQLYDYVHGPNYGGDTLLPLPNYTVMLNFNKDPNTQLVTAYTAVTDAKGNYTFTISTTNAQGYPDQAQVYVNALAGTMDTIKSSGRVIGQPGVYAAPPTITINNLTPNTISNDNYFTYNSFTAN